MMRLCTLTCLFPAALLIGCNVTEAPLETNQPASGPEAGSALSPGGPEVNDGTLAWSRVAVQGSGNAADTQGRFLVPGEGAQIDSNNNIRVKISVSSGTTGNDPGHENPATLDQLYLILAEDDDETGDESNEADEPDDVFGDGLRWPLCPDSETENGGCAFSEYEGWVSGIRVPNLEALGSLPSIEADQEDLAQWDTLYLGAEVGEQFFILDERPFKYNPTQIPFRRTPVVSSGGQLDIGWTAPSSSDTGHLDYVVRSFSVDAFIDRQDLIPESIGTEDPEDRLDSFLEDRLHSGFVEFLHDLFRRQEPVAGTDNSYSDAVSPDASRIYQVVGVNGHGIVAESEGVMTPPYLKTTKFSEWWWPEESEYSDYLGGYYLQYFGEHTCQIEWDDGSLGKPCSEVAYYSLLDGPDDPSDDDVIRVQTGLVFPCWIESRGGPESPVRGDEFDEPHSQSVDIVLTDLYGGVRRETLEQNCQ